MFAQSVDLPSWPAFPVPLAIGIAAPMVALFLLACAGSKWADRHSQSYRSAVTHLLLVQFLAAMLMTLALAAGLVTAGSVSFWSGDRIFPDGLLSISLRTDQLSDGHMRLSLTDPDLHLPSILMRICVRTTTFRFWGR
jgi:hypothetical protein